MIEKCAKTANTIVFAPHLTLLPGLHGQESELIKRTEKLANIFKNKKILVKTTGVESGQTYHKSLFFICDKTSDLVKFNLSAAKFSIQIVRITIPI
ncbi:MAG: hypothetical protein EXS49_00605 [Candidatus Pacebacteria bacterium]|nr:hypothetical protein [Candidatus Paceibacterota bacterium]